MPNPCIVSFFEELIENSFKMPKCAGSGSYVEIIESDEHAKNRSLKVGGAKLSAFSLDNEYQVFPYFSNAKEGMKSVCDGLMVVSHNDIEYLISIELKSSVRGKSKGIKQLRHGLKFLEFISEVGNHYEHCGKNFKKIAVINWGSNAVSKPVATMKPPQIPKPTKLGKNAYLFELPNHDHVSLPKLIEKIV